MFMKMVDSLHQYYVGHWPLCEAYLMFTTFLEYNQLPKRHAYEVTMGSV